MYFNQAPNATTSKAFVANCKKHLQEAHFTLDKHRGWSELLINILLAVTVIGLLTKGIINLATHHSFFHVHDTKSRKLLNQIETNLEKNASFQLG